MSIPLEGTHQHAKSGKVYSYRAEYRTQDGDVVWNASVLQDGELRLEPSGTVATQTPAADAIAESVVVDAVVRAIDTYDDGEPAL
jgi:hypothetical protein